MKRKGKGKGSGALAEARRLQQQLLAKLPQAAPKPEAKMADDEACAIVLEGGRWLAELRRRGTVLPDDPVNRARIERIERLCAQLTGDKT